LRIAAGTALGLGEIRAFILLGTPTREKQSVESIAIPSSTTEIITIRPPAAADYREWRLLWDGYNAFYGRSGRTAVPAEICDTTWRRFFDPAETLRALVAELDGKVVGIAHYLFHRSTNHLENLCYLEDLFTARAKRHRGVGRALIQAVCERAREAGSTRIYWMTHETNATAIALYTQVAERSGFIVFQHGL
jgi:GNAT superfamily N-acetyltransferase